MVKPAGRKQAARHLIEQHSISERAACQLAGVSRTGFRYQARPKDDSALRARLKELAAKQLAYGYLLLHGLLKAEGLVVNHKRTCRLYSEEDLQVRTKRRKKLHRPRQPLEVPRAVNERWSMDFVSDQLSSGRRFRVLNVVGDFSGEVVGQLVSVSIKAGELQRPVERIVRRHCSASWTRGVTSVAGLRQSAMLGWVATTTLIPPVPV